MKGITERTGEKYYRSDDIVHLVNSYIDSSYNRMDNSGYHEARAEGFEELLDDIFNLAQQEDTQVVECSECIFGKDYVLSSNEKPQRWCKIGDKAVNDDDYCSWGEIDILNIVYPVGAQFFNPYWQGKTPTEMFGGVWKEIEPNVYERIE